jgi:methyl-accepting chemotaxis protein
MNSCSLSKVRNSLAVAAIAASAVAVVQFINENWISGGVALVAPVALFVAYRYHQIVCGKIQLCADAISRAAGGELDARIVRLREDGVLGDLSRNANRLLDLTEAFAKESNTAMEYANQRRYFRKIIPTGLCGDFVYFATTINKSLGLMAARDEEFKDFVNTKVVSLANTVSQSATHLTANAHSILQLSKDTGQESVTAANGAHQASANVQAVAAAVEEFTVATAEIAQQVNRVADISRNAVDLLTKSDATVARLAEATDKIGGVLELINKIAAQTKLLALNATIEAARAGEAGKGFAVVAGEVKALAEQTAHATDEISGQVGHMKDISQETIAAMRDTNRAVREISDATTTVAAAAEEQKAASSEIARNLTEAVTATGAVSDAVSKVDSATQETMNGVQRVSSASGELSQFAATLLKQVDAFLERLGKAA